MTNWLVFQHPAKSPKSPAVKRQQASPPAPAPNSPNHQKTPQLGKKPRFIVGIGASAGGFEAYSQFFSHLPPDTGMAFVIVQHLDPVHESILPELVAKMTRMAVRQVTAAMPIEANEVYVISPNTDIAVSRGSLKITPRGDKRPYLPIDHLFRSLAEDQKDHAVGIIFSGTSSDGALGIEAIKHAGGITFAQDEASARYAFMPNAAIATRYVDFVLNPGEMALELSKITRHPFWSYYQTPAAELLPEVEKELQPILLLLQKVTGVNFTLYKRSTLKRRIMRRLVLHKLPDLESYLKFLEENHEEVEALYQDVLIKVTGFFRDEAAFDALKKTVFPEILANTPTDGLARFWVPGCSSGEEAYSLAMSWLEFIGDQAATVPIQIFATDVSDAVIDKARAGIYLENISSDLSPERLRRFFIKSNGGYQINKAIRDMCIFARQNLIQDPPFSKLDLISCRNVLIYLQTALQKRLIPMFHFSLNPAGFLMLGASETVGAFSDLFGLLDKKYKIYRKKSALARGKLDFLPPRFPREPRTLIKGRINGVEEPWSKQNLYADADRLILNRFAPAGVLINEDMDILQFRGQTGPYLKPAPGEASFKLLRMAREGLLLSLRTTVAQALKKNAVVKSQGLRVDYNGEGRTVDLEVIPLKVGPTKERFFLVLFEETAPPARPDAAAAPAPAIPAPKPGAKDKLIQGLREELGAIREHLHAVIADKEAANEELRAANEEILSANEEFQSVNEELETAKEELQSANEELTSLNEELNVRNAELIQLNNDYTNLLLSTSIPIIMLGRDLRIRHITPQAHELFNLIPGDVGRPISDIKLNLEIPGLDALALEVIDTLAVKTQEVKDSHGHWYRLTIRPYYTLDRKIDGAVITLTDINELKESLLQLKQHQDLVQGVYAAMGEALLVLDRDLRVKAANPAFYRTFQLAPEETVGLRVYELGNRQWDIPELRQLLEDILPMNATFQSFPVEHDFPGAGRLSLLLNGCRITKEQSLAGEDLILVTMANITELQKARESLQASASRHPTSGLFTAPRQECPILAWELQDLINRDLEALETSLRDIVLKLADPEKKPSCQEALTQIKENAAALLGIAWDAPPTILRHLGFTAALKNLVSEFRSYFHIDSSHDIDELNHLFIGESRKLIYRVLVEALYNTGRHSEATRAEVAIKQKGGQVSFLVKDNGKGFNSAQAWKAGAAKKGAGLAAMTERVRLLGGELKIWSKEGKGTQLTFSLPVKK
ncbi:MAG: chemotaxis protein CheB [Desulfobaccales bacterium]